MLKEKAKEMNRIKNDIGVLTNEIEKLSEGFQIGGQQGEDGLTLDQVQLEYETLQKSW